MRTDSARETHLAPTLLSTVSCSTLSRQRPVSILTSCSLLLTPHAARIYARRAPGRRRNHRHSYLSASAGVGQGAGAARADVAWQAFSRDMATDPNMAVYYTFQNDLGGSTMSNVAVSNPDDPTYLPSSMNLTMYDYGNAMQPCVNQSMIQFLWSNTGRFRGKPAASFLHTGTSGNMVIFPTIAQGSAMLGGLLGKSGAITIVAWVYVPPSLMGSSVAALVYWSDPYGNRTLNLHLPYSDNNVYWDTYWNIYGSGDRVPVPYISGNNSTAPWVLWCFTKTNATGMGKIYRNGQLVAAVVEPHVASSSTPYYQTAAITMSTPAANTNFTLGSLWGYGSWAGTMDEFAIFDSDLSPNDVTPLGVIIPGVPAVRFLQMYQMGSN